MKFLNMLFVGGLMGFMTYLECPVWLPLPVGVIVYTLLNIEDKLSD